MEQYNTLKDKPLRIHAGPISVVEYLREAWAYRHMLAVFFYQDIKAQFVQTRFNILWLVIRPLSVLLIFTIIFDRLIHIPGLRYPYPLFAFSGLIMWNYFSYLVNNVGNVLVSNQSILRKVYFPKYLLLISKTMVGLVEMLVSLVLILIMMVFFRYPVTGAVCFVPVFIFLNMIIGLGVATWLNSFNIRYRDLNQIAPSLFAFLIWLTPIFFPATLLPKQYDFIIYINPVAGAIQGFRWALLGDDFALVWFIPAFIFSVLLLLTGILIFIRQEAKIVDYI